LAYLLQLAGRKLALAFALGLGNRTSSLVIVIGFSRIYLGVHYVSDVIAGYLAASFWLALCISENDVAGRRRKLTSVKGQQNSETV
jgi:hypothetical protein